jgi:hypothetical protein
MILSKKLLMWRVKYVTATRESIIGSGLRASMVELQLPIVSAVA